jgi:S-adenosylmethionine hydrolase
MSIITLTTDYGLKDHFVGVMKGKIITEFAEAKIVDISHHIDPFNSFEASYILAAAYAKFPKGTIHIVGVDIELNKENKHVVVLFNDHYFICADNGILSLLMQNSAPQRMIEINIHEHLINNPTDIDAFIKAATHIAKGGNWNDLGTEIKEIKDVTDLKPTISDDKRILKGFVIYIDHYGNVVTNITKKMFLETANNRLFEIILNEKVMQKSRNPIKTVHDKYSDIAKNSSFSIKEFEGNKLAVFNESGFLEIAIFRSNPATVGSARSLLGLNYRDVISIEFA